MANDGWTITPGSLQQRFDATGGTDPVARGETLFNTKAISINGVRGLNPDGPVATFQTTDPGRALITGKWADRGRFKGPILRGLSARAPCFHNGSAATFDQVLDFYTSRCGVIFSANERHDLVAFLHTL